MNSYEHYASKEFGLDFGSNKVTIRTGKAKSGIAKCEMLFCKRKTMCRNLKFEVSQVYKTLEWNIESLNDENQWKRDYKNYATLKITLLNIIVAIYKTFIIIVK